MCVCAFDMEACKSELFSFFFIGLSPSAASFALAADYGERMTGSINVVVMCMYTVSVHTNTRTHAYNDSGLLKKNHTNFHIADVIATVYVKTLFLLCFDPKTNNAHNFCFDFELNKNKSGWNYLSSLSHLLFVFWIFG